MLQRFGNPQYLGEKAANDVKDHVIRFALYGRVAKIWKSSVTNHMGSISCHITPLVINSLGGGHTHILTFADKAILRNQAGAHLV